MATAKAGSVCKKLGATSTYLGKKHTCIKSGKKLIWNKGVAIAKPAPTNSPTPTPTPTNSPTPTPTPTPTNSPTPTPTPTPIWLKPFAEISKESRVDSSLLVYRNIEVSPNVDQTLVTRLLKYQDLASSYWKRLGFESQYRVNILILSEKDYSMYRAREIERKLSCTVYCNEKNWFSPDFSSRFQGTVLVENFNENIAGRSLPSGLTILYVIGTEMVVKNQNWASDLATAFTHEYGHLVQFSYLEGWKNFSSMACWNNEGFPALFEDAFYFEDASEINPIPSLRPLTSSTSWLTQRRASRLSGFKAARLSVLQSSPGFSGSNNVENWRKYFELTRQRNSDGCTKDGYGRSSGYFIAQLFYQDFGGKAFLDVLKLTNQYRDWDKAFKELTGKEYQFWLEDRAIPALIELFN